MASTAIANGLSPRLYVERLLEEMPYADKLVDEVVDGFLPWSPSVTDSCRMDRLYYLGQFREGRKSQEPMADSKHPRHFTDEFKRRIVELVNAGKPKADVMREYDQSKSTVDRWVESINESGRRTRPTTARPSRTA